MSTIVKETIKDATYATGEVERITAPHGASVPLAFKSFSYKGQKPTSHTNITWKLIIKADREDLDTAAILDITNASLTLSTAPIAVGYDLDTTASGFATNNLYYGELWADDTAFGKNPVKEFQLRLGNATRDTF